MDMKELQKDPKMLDLMKAIGEQMRARSKQEQMEKAKNYQILNEHVKKGQILFTGSSLMEQFPIAEIARNHGVEKMIYNRGIGGYTTDDFLTNIDTVLFDLEPSKIFINIGTNDMNIREDGEDWNAHLLTNYETILKQIKERLPETEVYMMAYYPVNPVVASDDVKTYMLQNVYSNNAHNMEEAKKFFADSNYSKTLEFLNKIQFIDYIATKREDKLVKEARDIAKKIFMQNKFVKDFYSKKTENEIFNKLSLQTRKESNKSILLYYYGDNQNAYNEFDKIYSKTQTTYPLFYYAQKIFLDSANTKRFMQICNNIGKYFGYPYSQNVDLLPEEFRKYIYPRYFDDLVVPEAKYYKIEPEFIYSIMREESLFDSKALSWAGARGLMQLMPATARAENKKTRYKFNPLNLYDSKQNIYLGISHLSWLFQSENASNYIIVAAKYNAGSSRGNRWKNEYGTNNMYRTGRFIDIEETEYYVEKVMKSYEYYSRYY